jgi:cytochrome P450
MSARDEAGEPMTDVELRDELMTLLAAGHETTASALTWALYWIHKLPEVREKLLQELDSLGDNPNPSSIARLPYLSAVCSETLRIYPVALITFSRRVKVPLPLMGYEFEPGTLLTGCIYLTHQREDLYPEPKRFKPERFLERQFSPFEYLPFGGGSRRCVGAAFAVFEMKLVLATILQDKQLALADNRQVKPVRRGLTSTPPGVRLVVTGERQKKERSPLAVASSV